MAYAKGRGIAHYQSCAVLQIEVRRVERWAVRLRHRGTMEYRKPGPKRVVHVIMPRSASSVSVCGAGRDGGLFVAAAGDKGW